MNLLNELGYDDKKQTDDFILFSERKVLTKTIMNDLSKGFTHYKKMANINKKVSFKNLRKTYLSWVNAIMNKDTGIYRHIQPIRYSKGTILPQLF